MIKALFLFTNLVRFFVFRFLFDSTSAQVCLKSMLGGQVTDGHRLVSQTDSTNFRYSLFALVEM